MPLSQLLWQHARREAPLECVGVLGGVQGADWEARVYVPLTNVDPLPSARYQADPAELLGTLRRWRGQSLELVGIFHSHPRGPAEPSERDRQWAAYPVPYLIADLRTEQLGAWWLPQGGTAEVTQV
ncbi:Mov34/MPN/PAD-1 family protein [Deinococcus lacus]|uniref:Mov34/MPN/PAD-1 family protein n=1 Tax=Deinococcus lacus TaxID=392561 RepID=A0ABW1Y9K9_9DEIO